MDAAASQMPARYAVDMRCSRCDGERKNVTSPWCRTCEAQYETWARRYATDLLWQAVIGAIVAMGLVVGLQELALDAVIANLVGGLVGFQAFQKVRSWGEERRRRQFLEGALPRAYLPSKM